MPLHYGCKFSFSIGNCVFGKIIQIICAWEKRIYLISCICFSRRAPWIFIRCQLISSNVVFIVCFDILKAIDSRVSNSIRTYSLQCREVIKENDYNWITKWTLYRFAAEMSSVFDSIGNMYFMFPACVCIANIACRKSLNANR